MEHPALDHRDGDAGVAHLALTGTKFPWPLVLPLLLFGPMLASNRMLSRASGEGTDGPEAKEPNV